MKLGSASVLKADARSLPLADGSVDLVVTSPPYFALRSYTDDGEHYAGQVGAEGSPDEYVAALIEATREMVRVVKPEGSIFVDLGDKYAGGGAGPPSESSGLVGNGHVGGGPKRTRVVHTSTPKGAVPQKSLMLLPERYRIAAVDQLGLICRSVIVWSKPNGLPESVTDRVRRSHEDWVHLTRRPRYYAAVDEIRQPQMYPSAKRTKGKSMNGGTASGSPSDTPALNPLGALPGSVWTIATEPLRVPDWLDIDHFAAFPTEWPRRLIAAFCPEGGTVLDPFGGTGTTALVAKATGRHGITADLSADYCRLAAWRVNDADSIRKVRRRSHDDKQASLFVEPA